MHLILVSIGQIQKLYIHPAHALLAGASSRLRSSTFRLLGTGHWGLGIGDWGLGGGGRRSGRIFLRNKKLRVPRSWLRGSGRIGPGRWSCCGCRRGECDGGCAGAQRSRRGRPRLPEVLVDEAAAARTLHEQAAAATGAGAPAVFGPRGGTKSRLPGGRRLAGVRTLSVARPSHPLPAVPGAHRATAWRRAGDAQPFHRLQIREPARRARPDLSARPSPVLRALGGVGVAGVRGAEVSAHRAPSQSLRPARSCFERELSAVFQIILRR